MQAQLKKIAAPGGIFLISLILFLWGIRDQEVVSFDSRFYLFAQEMWRHGLSWFPTTYRQYYPDYTAASTFVILIFAKLFGGVTKFVAVVPTAIAAATTVVLTYLIAAKRDKRWAWYAAILLVFTFSFIKSARAIALDMYPCLVTATCFYVLHVIRVGYYKKLGLLLALFFVGFVFRGPIGLVIPTGVACTYYLLDKDIRRFFYTGLSALVLLVVSTVLLLALAYYVNDVSFTQNVFRMQLSSRIDARFLPVYFYFINSLHNYAMAYPMAIFTMLGMFVQRQQNADRLFLLKLTAWALIIYIGMSVPGEKKVRYILPAAPALALLAAYPLTQLNRTLYFRVLRHIATIFFLLMPTIFLLAAWFVNQRLHLVQLGYVIPSAMFVFFVLAQVVALTLYIASKQKQTVVLLVAFACFIGAYFNIIEPIELAIDKGRDFVTQVEQLRSQRAAQLVFFQQSPDGLPIKYLIHLKQDVQPVFLHTTAELHAYRAPAVLLVEQDDFEALSKQIQSRYVVILTGKLGHDDMIVLRRK